MNAERELLLALRIAVHGRCPRDPHANVEEIIERYEKLLGMS